MPDDLSQLKVELATALANNEILSGNVETLRALSLQLAVQVEELNVQLKTAKTDSETASLRNARDAQIVLDDVHQRYHEQIGQLRSALASEEEALRETVAMWENREAAAERRILNLEREKDNTISSLSHEIEVLRQSMHFQIRGGTTPIKRVSRPSLPAQPLGRRFSGDSTDPLTNIISVAVALQTAEAENLRLTANGSALRNDRRLYTEIIADPLLLELVGSPEEKQDSQKWVFRLPNGEQIAISIQLL